MGKRRRSESMVSHADYADGEVGPGIMEEFSTTRFNSNRYGHDQGELKIFDGRRKRGGGFMKGLVKLTRLF